MDVTKERVVIFGDAIIAIILTIMVLELPIQYATDGTVNVPSIFSAVGIYFISFCFVANLWFQTAYAFNQIEQVKNKSLVSYMLLLFFLSLVPSATRLLIEDTTQQTVLIYGILTLIVTLIMRRLIVVLTKQTIPDLKLQKRRIDELNRQDMFSIGFRILLLIFGFFFSQVALIIYLILPIMAFLQNIVDREEDNFVDTLDNEQQTQYFQERDHLWGNTMKRYSYLLRDSLRDGDDRNPDRWKQITSEWQGRIDQEIAECKQQLVTSNESDKANLEQKIEQLEKQKDRLHQQEERLQHKEVRSQQRIQRKPRG
ncbi:TMEM175 family protein [Carnobacterium gallinarum]|uniref:TMEM175 family protein n=1 Tax=Carnobacterium gallinarum TaxID=2749 RepID=UPI0005523A6D|nr:TMEM175 family protein [Carnobacterium gallinarum]